MTKLIYGKKLMNQCMKNKSEFKYAYLVCTTHPIDELFVGSDKEIPGGKYACELLADKILTVPEEHVLGKFRDFKEGNFFVAPK